jgi:hypothetical protein
LENSIDDIKNKEYEEYQNKAYVNKMLEENNEQEFK